ncbi:MAG TPA: GNAT family N-acetyltransferase [Anaerolineales bacterium]
MDFEKHADFSSIDPQEWNALAAEGVSDVPFLRHEYLKAWWGTRGGGEWPQAELALISAREGGRLVGIAPLFKAEYEGRSSLLLLGSIEISDYLDLIVREADLEPFLSALLDYLDMEPSLAGWQGLDWYNVPEGSPTLPALRRLAEKRGWSYTEEVYRPTPAIVLPGGFEAYLATVEKKQRHEIRRKVRRAEESGRGVRWYRVTDAGTLDAEMESLFRLMENDPAKAQFLTPAMREQMRLTAHLAFENDWLWLAFLEIDGQKAACAFNFDYCGRLWGYNSGVDRRFMELSPGWVLLAYVLQWAADNGRSEFDFMRGGEEYKYRFGAVDRHVMKAVVGRGEMPATDEHG